MIKFSGIPGAALAAILRSARLHAAYDGTAGWKKKADGSLEVDGSGNPIWVAADGKESNPAEVITALNSESAAYRKRAETAETKASQLETTFKDIDPAKAREAIDKLGRIDAKQLIDAGKVDEVRDEVNKAWEPKLTAAEQRAKDAETELSGLRLTTAFGGSKFISEKLTIPADLARAQFGQSFAWDNGKFVAKRPDGSVIYSGKNAGQHADFDEALETLVNEYPHKASILKGANNSGAGNDGKGGAGGGGKKTLNMKEFTALTPAQQAEHSAAVRAGTAELVD